MLSSTLITLTMGSAGLLITQSITCQFEDLTAMMQLMMCCVTWHMHSISLLKWNQVIILHFVTLIISLTIHYVTFLLHHHHSPDCCNKFHTLTIQWTVMMDEPAKWKVITTKTATTVLCVSTLDCHSNLKDPHLKKEVLSS